MKTALITGISGQDGGYLAKLLLEEGYRVIGTVRSYSASLKNLKYLSIDNNIIIEELDLTDIINIIQIFKKYEPGEIYNLAAQSSVSLSFEQPISTFSFNTISVNNLLESIRLFLPLAKLYQSSSSEMYGNVESLPIDVKTPIHPLSPYAVSKVSAYFMCANYRKAYGLFICNGILFNHESFLRSSNFFIKKVIRDAVLIKNKKLDKLVVGNLNIKRDFGFAPKYVEAMWKMLQKDKPEDYIVCSGKSVKLLDIVEYILSRLSLNKKVIEVDKTLFRPNEIGDIYGDNLETKKMLNWEYDYSFFDVLDILIKEEIEYSKKQIW
jgi:GDPmannose 4,6-dehydratase